MLFRYSFCPMNDISHSSRVLNLVSYTLRFIHFLRRQLYKELVNDPYTLTLKSNEKSRQKPIIGIDIPHQHFKSIDTLDSIDFLTLTENTLTIVDKYVQISK